MRRFFFMGASPETVRRTLHEAELIEKPSRKKPKRNIQKPRFFERATPNQLWQSDIMCFRLAGRNAYVIGYIDDYSRYITGLDLYRSQTAEHVIETYRRGISEYGAPREMLTDNGRQYTNWRGATRFEKELKKDRVKHIKSRPHHPMTLGKIERFWKSLLDEFLYRAQFSSFEDARARLAIWVKYYNHKRPHQGIGGLCPADRFFEIQHELRKAIATGVAENSLELALRGKPVDPFYMVGRMGEQNVVIRAEKGKVRMMVDGKDEDKSKEMVYELEKEGIQCENKEAERKAHIYGGREEQGCSFDMERAAHGDGHKQGNERVSRPTEQVTESCHGGNAGCARVEERAGENARFEPSIGEASGKESVVSQGEFWQAAEALGQPHKIERGSPGKVKEKAYKEWGKEEQFQQESGRSHSGWNYPKSQELFSESSGCGEDFRGIQKDLLQVGNAGAVGPCQCARCREERASRACAGRPGEAKTSGGNCEPSQRELPAREEDASQRHSSPVGAGHLGRHRQ